MDLRACVPDRHTLVRRMRDYRYRAGVTAEEAASRIGKMATTVYKYEAGRLRVSEPDLLALLDLYGVDLEHAFVDGRSAPLGEGRRKDPAALTWRKLGKVYETLPPARQRLLLDVARSMSGTDGA